MSDVTTPVAQLTAGPEPFMAGLAEIKPLLPLHWRELGIYQDRMPLDPDWPAFQRLEDAGVLLYVALRRAGVLIGYFVGFVGPSLHYASTATCKMDLIYILPQYRHSGAGRVLLDAVKAELVRRGVKLWWMGSKDHHPIEGFFEAYGFERQETYLAMWIGDEHA